MQQHAASFIARTEASTGSELPNCGGGELKTITAILERPVIEEILTHLGLDPQPPPRGRARKVGQG